MKTKIMGLKSATQQEIQEHTYYWESKGYAVTHKTKGLPHNGILIIK